MSNEIDLSVSSYSRRNFSTSIARESEQYETAEASARNR